jgi:integrase
MSEDHSTGQPVRSKPAKPSPDFPLTAHAGGRWCKKIAGKTRYFGRWEDPKGALAEYRAFVSGKPMKKAARPRPEHTERPAKPSPDFPLFAHAARVWAKKIRGKLHYFGPWDDPDGALDKYLAQKDALHAGRKPRETSEDATVHELVNRFLRQKEDLVDVGELSPRTWTDYKDACDQIVTGFGKQRLLDDLAPDDFSELRNKMAKKWGPHRLGNTIQRIRTVFKFGFEVGLLSTPIRYGPGFKRPSKKSVRLHRAKQGLKLFTVEEVRRLLGAAGTPMKAIILLGINAGFGNADVGNLPLSAMDLERGWIDYPRPKTGIPRRCSLWPETMEAIREALARRPKPEDEADASLVFLTQRGLSWSKDIADSPITKETRKLLDALGMNGHRSFYALRHTFRTVADESKDQPAVDYIMGHEVPHMSSVYRETISDERLKAVADHVRAWLFGGTEKAAKSRAAKARKSAC